jgi:septal ring factor EnvC (AmiA/AmiB activator)
LEDSFLLLSLGAVLLLHFFSSANVYKSLYHKVQEENSLETQKIEKLRENLDKYEKHIKNSVATLEKTQETLAIAREDIQNLKRQNTELKHHNTVLEKQSEELIAQVKAVV